MIFQHEKFLRMFRKKVELILRSGVLRSRFWLRLIRTLRYYLVNFQCVSQGLLRRALSMVLKIRRNQSWQQCRNAWNNVSVTNRKYLNCLGKLFLGFHVSGKRLNSWRGFSLERSSPLDNPRNSNVDPLLTIHVVSLKFIQSHFLLRRKKPFGSYESRDSKRSRRHKQMVRQNCHHRFALVKS